MKFAAIGLFLVVAWAADPDATEAPDVGVQAKAAVGLNLGLGWGLPPLDSCRRCGDACTVNGQSGYCGLNLGCKTGARPLCGGIDGGLFGCTKDSDCSAGKYCLRTGLFGKCVARTCHTGPYLASETSAVSRADIDASASLSLFPWNNCPSGYKCVNGVCVMCPMVKCINPNCPGGTRTPTDANGCPGCPVCIDNGCNADADCPSGQQCVRIGSYGRCQARTCFSFPLVAADFSAASRPVDASIAYPFPWNHCPTGQYCANGVCRQCPVVDCIPPPCEGGTLVPSTMDNGCPGCPKCSIEGGTGCFNDASCPADQQCVRVGFYGKCQPRGCAAIPYSVAGSLTASAASSDTSVAASANGLYYNRCPSGQYCMNGVCRLCPQLACVRPMCTVGSHLITPTMDNGCPGCPRCVPCVGRNCNNIALPLTDTPTP